MWTTSGKLQLKSRLKNEESKTMSLEFSRQCCCLYFWMGNWAQRSVFVLIKTHLLLTVLCCCSSKKCRSLLFVFNLCVVCSQMLSSIDQPLHHRALCVHRCNICSKASTHLCCKARSFYKLFSGWALFLYFYCFVHIYIYIYIYILIDWLI